ncbi:MAG: PD-(D/E)XK nuclease family protein [Luteolibacter sp.]
MVESSQAILSPRVTTPGQLIRSIDAHAAPDWVEQLAWLETLKKIRNWEHYSSLFPKPGLSGGTWIEGIAHEWVKLRHTLQENGLTMAMAAEEMGRQHSAEAGRWNELAILEARMEQQLNQWGFESRSSRLAQKIPQPDSITHVIIAGVAGLPPVIESSIESWMLPVTIMIAAPESESHNFSLWGKPLESWCNRSLPWPSPPSGAVHLVADPRQAAKQTLLCVADQKTPSNDVAIGCSDPASGEWIAATFSQNGWPAHHPAAPQAERALSRWLKCWRNWVVQPDLAHAADLIAHPATAALLEINRLDLTKHLARFRDSWLAQTPGDLRTRIQAGSIQHSSRLGKAEAEQVLSALSQLESWRQQMIADFPSSASSMLGSIDGIDEDWIDDCTQACNWLITAESLIRAVEHPAEFWIDVMLKQIPTAYPDPPENRVIDIQGWLEMLLEPAKHLVLCGMNEGLIPASIHGDPWLGEKARKILGLPSNSEIAARDAFIYHSLVSMRKSDGRVDVICFKSGANGQTLLPSRLLLAAEREELAQRVKLLFDSVEPPEAGMRWVSDWNWDPGPAVAPKRLAVTHLKSWLECPFRYYLKHSLGMNMPDPSRIEWNAGDYGSNIHHILERWGRDITARNATKEDEIRDWLLADLDRLIQESFENQVPLAVQLQAESMRQRLSWFAKIQSRLRSEGWEIDEVEQDFEIPLGNHHIKGKIDRIDRCSATGAIRVIDYKSGAVKSVEDAHRKKIGKSYTVPEHLPEDCPAFFHSIPPEKPATFVWTNLQLPLYAEHIRQTHQSLAIPCYISLGNTETHTKLSEWEKFDSYLLDSAMQCADWVVKQIDAAVFWPPAAKVGYDEFKSLSMGRPLNEVFDPTS